MSTKLNTIDIPDVTLDELDKLIRHNAMFYEMYKSQPFEEEVFRDRIRILNIKKEALLKKIAHNTKCAKSASNEAS